MRITKKFAGASCIGKQIFTPCGDVTPAEQDKWNRELNSLKEAFVNRQNNKLSYLSRGTERTAATAIAYNLQINVADKAFSSAVNKTAKERGQKSAYGYDDEAESSSKGEPKKIQKAKVPKRIMSSPNLQMLQVRTVLSPIAGSVPIDHTLAAQQLKLKRTLKRAHSSMSITECDNLVSDHDAANDLFLQFVSKVTHDINVAVTSAEERRHNMSPTLRPQLESLKLEAAPVSDDNQVSPEGKMSVPTTFPPTIKIESESDDALTYLGSPNGRTTDTHAYIASHSSSSGSPVGLEMDCEDDDADDEDEEEEDDVSYSKRSMDSMAKGFSPAISGINFDFRSIL